MHILVQAPFLSVLGGLVAAMALSRNGTVPGALFLAPLFTAALALLSYEKPSPDKRQASVKEPAGQWGVLVIIVALSFLCGLRGWTVLSRSSASLSDEPRAIETHGIVTLVRSWGRGCIATVDTPDGNFLVNFYHPTQVNVVEGMTVKLSGITAPLRPNSEGHDGLDEWLYWNARGVTSRLLKAHLSPVGAETRVNLHTLRYGITRVLTIHLPELTSSYLRAAWTGQRDKSLNDKHRAWGTSHLLAVSGFHVGLVVLFFNAVAAIILRILKRPCQTSATLACLAFMWSYVLLTGAAPSALRAGLMVQVALTAGLLGRPNSALNSVSIASVLLLVYSPFLFWDIGWRLSVLAAMTLTALSAISVKLQAFTVWLILSPIISVISFPQVARTFQSIPAVGIVLNFFAPTFFAFAFNLASLGAVLKFLGLLGMPFDWLASLLLRMTEGSFALWGLVADGVASVIPFQIGWNIFLAWLGTGTLIFLLCRAVRLSVAHTALLVPAFSFAAFLLFL